MPKRPRPRPRRRYLPVKIKARAFAALLLLCALPGCEAGAANDAGSETPAQSPRLGLFSSLPIYWGESADIGAAIDGGGEPGWLRQVLERRNVLAPLDALEPETLAGLERLLLAQPRPLAPSENVALDDWVRAGGRALIFADPMLTRHSDYALGDKRRPADMVLLSPILARWGLELRFDDSQPAGERLMESAGAAIPVDLAGEFVARESGARSSCAITASGLIARCRIGKGRVDLIADAAVLDQEGAAIDAEQRAEIVEQLLAQAL